MGTSPFPPHPNISSGLLPAAGNLASGNQQDELGNVLIYVRSIQNLRNRDEFSLLNYFIFFNKEVTPGPPSPSNGTVKGREGKGMCKPPQGNLCLFEPYFLFNKTIQIVSKREERFAEKRGV